MIMGPHKYAQKQGWGNPQVLSLNVILKIKYPIIFSVQNIRTSKPNIFVETFNQFWQHFIKFSFKFDCVLMILNKKIVEKKIL